MNKIDIDFEMENFHQTKKRLFEFCGQCKHIFLYGAGKYGEVCFNILKKQHISVEGFLVTDGSDMEYLGIPVYLVKEKLQVMYPETGVIFSLKKNSQEDVKKYFTNIDNVKIFELEDSFFQNYQLGIMVKTLKQINANAPAKMPISKPKDWRKILIIRLDAVGDMIWTTAFFRELKKNFSRSKVTLVVRKSIYPLVENCPYIDEILLYECTLRETLVCEHMDENARCFAQQYLIKEQFDVVFLPEFLPKSPYCKLGVLLAMYSGARYRIARAHYFEPLEKRVCLAMEDMFSVVVKHDTVEHEVLRILKLLEVCGIRIKNDKMELWLNARDEVFAKHVINRYKTDLTLFIAVAPVSNDANRIWDASNYAKLIKSILSRYGNRVKFVLLGGENAKTVSNAIETDGLGSDVLNLINGTTLSQAAALIQYCDMYLGANTGLLHMASVFEKPILEISAYLRNGRATARLNPERVGAWHVYNRVIKPEGLENCQDCCQKPYAHCINQITVEEVQHEIEEMISYILEKNKKCM